jgi:hypothetical protein
VSLGGRDPVCGGTEGECRAGHEVDDDEGAEPAELRDGLDQVAARHHGQ